MVKLDCQRLHEARAYVEQRNDVTAPMLAAHLQTSLAKAKLLLAAVALPPTPVKEKRDGAPYGRTAAQKKFDRQVGARLSQLRQQARLSERELAEKLGLTEKQLRAYESGRWILFAATLFKAARFFNVSVNVFFTPALPLDHSVRAGHDSKVVRNGGDPVRATEVRSSDMR